MGVWGRGVATKHLVKVQPQPFRCGSETPPGDAVYVQGQGRRRFLDAACSVARILMGFLFVGRGGREEVAGRGRVARCVGFSPPKKDVAAKSA